MARQRSVTLSRNSDILRDLQKFSKFSVQQSKMNSLDFLVPMYVGASSVELQSFGRTCKQEMTEVCVLVFHCNNRESSHDDDLLPFFHSNPELSEIFKIISNNDNEPEQRKKIAVARYLSCITFMETNREFRGPNDRRLHADNNTYCYSEGTWMKRLYKAVSSRYQNDDVDYTAPLWGDSCNQAVLRRMPKGTPIDSPLFHGFPDIIIKYGSRRK